MHADALEQYIKAWEPTYGPEPVSAQHAEELAAFKASLIAHVNDPSKLERGLSLRGQGERLQELIQEQMLTWRNEQLEKIFAASTVDEQVQIAQLAARIAVDPTAAVELAQVQARLGEAASVYGASVEKPLVDAAAEQALDAKLAPPPPPNTLEGMRYALGKRVDDMLANPPAGATPEEVAELRDDLRVLADNFAPAPGQTVEGAFALVQREIKSSLDDFIEQESTERTQEAKASEAVQDAADMKSFMEYQSAVKDYVNAFQPTWGWGNQLDQGRLNAEKARWIADATAPNRFNPDMPLRQQQVVLEEQIQSQMRLWRNAELEAGFRERIAPYNDEMARLRGIIEDRATSPEARDEAMAQLDQQSNLADIAIAFHQASINDALAKPEAEQALDAKLAPEPPPPTLIEFDEQTVSQSAVTELVGGAAAMKKVVDIFDEPGAVMAAATVAGAAGATVADVAVDDDVVMGDAGAADMTMAATSTPTAATAPATGTPPPEVPPPPGTTPRADATDTYDPYASGVGELDQTGTGDVDDPVGVDDITGPDDPTVPDPNDQQDQQY